MTKAEFIKTMEKENVDIHVYSLTQLLWNYKPHAIAQAEAADEATEEAYKAYKPYEEVDGAEADRLCDEYEKAYQTQRNLEDDCDTIDELLELLDKVDFLFRALAE